MASFQLVGFIESIKYLPNQGGCFVFLSEYKKGYKKQDGEIVQDKYMSWKIIFKQGLVNYINNHFSNGMLVEIKGEILPYAIKNQEIMDGYSVIGQCINLFGFPRATLRQEQRMIKESQLNMDETPNLDDHIKPDF